MDGNETIYLVSIGESNDIVIDLKVNTSSAIAVEMVFEDLNGDCYVGMLDSPFPSVNHLSLDNPDRTPTPLATNDDSVDPYDPNEQTPTPSVSPSPFYPFGTPTPLMGDGTYDPVDPSDPTPTPYYAFGTPTPPMIIDPTPTPLTSSEDDNQDQMQTNYDNEYHLHMRKTFSDMVSGRSYYYDIEFSLSES